MGRLKKWMLGAALAAGIVGMSAAPAQAARVQFGVYVSQPGYVAPYPGPGYVWVDGYWANGYWVPGYWNYVGVDPGFRGGIVIGHGPYYGRRYDWDRDRGWDRDRDHWRDRDRDHWRDHDRR
jgi:hypothetical protein